MLQPQSWGEDYSLHTSTSVVAEFARREFAFRLSPTAMSPSPQISLRLGRGREIPLDYKVPPKRAARRCEWVQRRRTQTFLSDGVNRSEPRDFQPASERHDVIPGL